MTEQSQNHIHEKIKLRLEKMVLKNKDPKNALLLVHSDKFKIHWKFAFGTTEQKQNPLTIDNPYYIASIGKAFTSLIIAKLYERGKIIVNVKNKFAYPSPQPSPLPSPKRLRAGRHKGRGDSFYFPSLERLCSNVILRR